MAAVTGAPLSGTASSTDAINPNEITVIDGDTIRARGRTVRLVGFDALESGTLASYRIPQTIAVMNSSAVALGLNSTLPHARAARPRSSGSFQPRLARSAAIRRVDALRDDALQAHVARVREY